MRQRIQLPERDEYSRIVARIPADLDQACRRLAKSEGWEQIAPEKTSAPFWLTDIPREFYDYQDDATGAWRNYDLFLPEGYGEVISGAEREYEYSKIVKKLERDGVRKDDYAFLLSLAKDGKLKPSAGAGLGFERFIAYLCGVKHVAEVQPFPRVPGMVPPL